ncbi:MAG: hypothetical protein GY705_23105 [Bacteroidetes bacterium]|nr:hypothetical protein [Bacteroidota bacterium]
MKSLFLLLFFAFTHTLLPAQDYHPFPLEDGAVWSTLRINYPSNGVSDTTTIQYGISGDSIIDGIKYYRIWGCMASIFHVNHETSFYKGSIREENKVITFIPEGTDNIDTLYNLNLEIGDLFKQSYTDYGWPVYFYLHSSDSTQLIDESYRRSYHYVVQFEGYEPLEYAFTIIEGIGNSNGLFYSVEEPYHLLRWKERLLCFGNNEELILKNSDFFDCYYAQIKT